MPLTKRAFLYITRKKGKSILFLAVLFTIAALVLTGFAVGNASERAAASLRETLGGYFKIEENLTGQRVTDALVGEIAAFDGIKGYNGMDILYLNVEDGLVLTPGRFTSDGDEKAQMARFLSNTDSSLHEYFVTKAFVLTEGRHIAPGDERKAVVSETFAETNGLSVGDSFTAEITENTAGIETDAVGQSFPYEIAGLFRVETEQGSGSGIPAECDIPDNFIFTDTKSGRAVLEAVTGQPVQCYRYGAAFFARDPQELGSLIARAQEIGGVNWDGLEVAVNDKAYQDSIRPLEKMGGFTMMIVLVILAVSVALLSLILIMHIRDRMHEIGVYLSIGIRKAGIVGQLLLECILIAAAAFCLAGIVAGPLAQGAGNLLIPRLEETESIGQGGGTGLSALMEDPVEVDYSSEAADAIEITVGPGEFAEVVFYGMLAVVAAVGLSSILIIRMKPRDILSSMS
ncbi:ABC transporter permease [Christensenella tenuis]|uniref:ABC transporter permease n=1 Tax=Christensenella tenuis TaxID=2763033 RepID=A0ABR7EGV5_9FIRM|nr:ABC transporter permease [Christensenella tenuis]MBC5648986.1 ABC transporter permease [Christensenella tenuis]